VEPQLQPNGLRCSLENQSKYVKILIFLVNITRIKYQKDHGPALRSQISFSKIKIFKFTFDRDNPNNIDNHNRRLGSHLPLDFYILGKCTFHLYS
jgi:hypothetical protein